MTKRKIKLFFTIGLLFFGLIICSRTIVNAEENIKAYTLEQDGEVITLNLHTDTKQYELVYTGDAKIQGKYTIEEGIVTLFLQDKEFAKVKLNDVDQTFNFELNLLEQVSKLQDSATQSLKDLLGEETYQFINYIITALVGFLSSLGAIVILIRKIKHALNKNTDTNEKISNATIKMAKSVNSVPEKVDGLTNDFNTTTEQVNKVLVAQEQTIKEVKEETNKTLEDVKNKYADLEKVQDSILKILTISSLNNDVLVSKGKAKEIAQIVGDLNYGKKEK